MKKRIKINGIIIVIAFIVILAFPEVFFRRTLSAAAEAFLGTTGLLLILLGQVIRVSARGYKWEFSQNSCLLIEGGPYQIVRNPMYLGILVTGLGVVLALFQWWVLLVFLMVFASRYVPLIISEENKLRNMFGGAYARYCSRVPRLFPRPSSLVQVRQKEYLPLKPAWFKKELGSIIALLTVTLWFFFWKR